MTNNDVMREQLKHVRRVGVLLSEVIQNLLNRINDHDNSKFDDDEFEFFKNNTANLKGTTYGSHEYMSQLGDVLKLHYQRNRHHPQHFENGILGMNLIDLIEMLADWKAATERHADGDLCKSIFINAKRFNYDSNYITLLGNTCIYLGWISAFDFEKQFKEYYSK